MSWFSWLVDKLIERAKKTPYRHLPGYMHRYWLIPYGKLPFAVRVHNILRGDVDRVFHDHPWHFITIILRGEYTEVTPEFDSGVYVGERRKTYKAGAVLFRSARSWHRLELPEGRDVWTLFFTGPKVQRWGFLTEPRHKEYWRDYLGDYDSQGTPGG